MGSVPRHGKVLTWRGTDPIAELKCWHIYSLIDDVLWYHDWINAIDVRIYGLHLLCNGSFISLYFQRYIRLHILCFCFIFFFFSFYNLVYLLHLYYFIVFIILFY